MFFNFNQAVMGQVNKIHIRQTKLHSSAKNKNLAALDIFGILHIL